eukprot:365594-Chlamydomonas_euryale.AAC.7
MPSTRRAPQRTSPHHTLNPLACPRFCTSLPTCPCLMVIAPCTGGHQPDPENLICSAPRRGIASARSFACGCGTRERGVAPPPPVCVESATACPWSPGASGPTGADRHSRDLGGERGEGLCERQDLGDHSRAQSQECDSSQRQRRSDDPDDGAGKERQQVPSLERHTRRWRDEPHDGGNGHADAQVLQAEQACAQVSQAGLPLNAVPRGNEPGREQGRNDR